MAPSNEASRVRSRRSFAQMPRRDIDGENTTSDVGAISKSQADEAAQRKRDKKLRSKSLGPGGLDALKPRTNDRRKSTLQFPLKSILKPQVPVSPVQNIPTFEETRRRTPGKTPQRARQSLIPGTGDLINFFSPGNTGTDPQGNPFDSFSPVGIPLRTEEEQQAASREREEREKREQEKKSILEQREARRKSLANRRVSFAPEATLHTWNVVEANEDSTTSSAANSTRRASQIGNETAEPQAASSDPAEASDTPTTPEHHGMDTSTPESQHARQSANDRRASGVSLNTEENEAFSSSPYGSAVDERESTNIVDENEDDGSESDSDPGDTVMSMDNVTETSHASSSQDSTAKLEENLRKAAQEAGTKGIDHDENGDLSMEFTEIQGAFQPWIKKGASAKFDDMTTTFTQKDLAFEQPLADAGPAGSEATDDEGDLNNTGEMSMDMTSALGQIIRRQEDEYSDEAKTPPGNTPGHDRTQATIGQDQTMEFTNVVGGIAENAGNEEPESSPFKPVPSEGDEANDEGTTMELTTVFGGGVINKGRQWDDFEAEDDQQSNADTTEYTQNTNYGDDDMEMTRPMGGILSTIEEQTEPQEDINFTVGMDMTNAIGKILPTQPTIHEEASSLFSRDSFSRGSNQRRQSVTRVSEAGSPMPMSPEQRIAKEKETQGRQEREKPQETAAQETPTKEQDASVPESTTPPAKDVPQSDKDTPESEKRKDSVPEPEEQPLYPELPKVSEEEGGKEHEAQDTTHDTPQEQNTPEQRTPEQKTPSKQSSLFVEDQRTGQATPSFVLRPPIRKSAGVSTDKESNEVARATEDSAQRPPPDASAAPPSRGVRFEPKEAEKNDEEERDEEEEDPRHLEQYATNNLKDLIQSMSPKKKKPSKMNARKSLHAGSALGLLGKRPAELDMDSDEEDETPNKKFKGNEGSPLKGVKSPAPLTRNPMTSRLRQRLSLFSQSPAKGSTTPKETPRFSHNATSPAPPSARNMSEELPSRQTSEQPPAPTVREKPASGRKTLSLQDFLKQATASSMELTTKKRRHTMAHGDQQPEPIKEVPEPEQEEEPPVDNTPPSVPTAQPLESTVEEEEPQEEQVTQHTEPQPEPQPAEEAREEEVQLGAEEASAPDETAQLLETYEQACRGLEEYVSRGVNVIRSVEEKTSFEMPSELEEYSFATTDVRILLDNQLRSYRTSARLQSKAMWYEARVKLDELREGLDKHMESMDSDEQKMIGDVVPKLVEKHTHMQQRVEEAQDRLAELDSNDEGDSPERQKQLAEAEESLERRSEEKQRLETQIEEITEIVRGANESKAQLLQGIEDAEQVMSDRRRNHLREVRRVKAFIKALEKKTGWSMVSVSGEPESEVGPAMTMRYLEELMVTFYPKAFGKAQDVQFPSVDFQYARRTSEGEARKSTPPLAKKMILAALQHNIGERYFQNEEPSALDFLVGVARSWDRAIHLSEEIRLLGFCGASRCKAIEGNRLRVRCMIVSLDRKRKASPSSVEDGATTPDEGSHLAKSRLDVDITVTPQTDDEASAEVHLDMQVSASAVYGWKDTRALHMADLLDKAMNDADFGTVSKLGKGVWRDAIRRCQKRVPV